MSALGLPAFDPDSPDAEILAAYESLLASRASVYAWDDRETTAEQDAAMLLSDRAQQGDEGLIASRFASTPSGVTTKLGLALTTECDRWVDSTLSQQGFNALYERRNDLSWRDQLIADAYSELLHLEWHRRLDEYRTSAHLYALAVEIKSNAEEERFRLRRLKEAEPAFLTALMALIDRLENDTANSAEINRLYRTLTPTTAALHTKLHIIIEEADDAPVDWIARDFAFLDGLPRSANHGPNLSGPRNSQAGEA